MTRGFVEFDRHLAGGQLPVANLDQAELSAAGTRLRFAEQCGLLQCKVLGDMLGNGLADLASSGFDAGKGGGLAGHIGIVQMDAEFFCEVFDSTLILIGP